jgi:LPS-assembly protein
MSASADLRRRHIIACALMCAVTSASVRADVVVTTEAEADADAARPAQATTSADVPGLGQTPPPGPAEVPRAPNMLGGMPPEVQASPIAANPYLRTPSFDRLGPSAQVSYDEPLWVLPPSAIPDYIPTRPGAIPVRDRGYLDAPGDVAMVSKEEIETNSGKLHADLDWDYCGPRVGSLTSGAPGDATDPGSDQFTDLDAGGLRYRRQADVIDAVGGVTVVRGVQRVEADNLTYDRGRATVISPRESYIQYPGIRLVGDGVEANLETEQARVDTPRFRLNGAINARGAADTAYVASRERTAYADILYTTCPPGSNAWSIRANKLKLDQYAGVGVARDARLRIRGVPILYTPYLQFPIDNRRRSGFLMPSFGSSSDNGFEIYTPYYWNIAPQMDATFHPRLMSKRGMLLGGEFRYVTRNDKGEIRAELLPSDKLYDDGDSARWAVNATEEGTWFKRLRTTLDFSAVSDNQYLEDLGSNINVTSARYLQQNGIAQYIGQGWSASAQLQRFQTIDDSLTEQNYPYARLPRIGFVLNQRQLLPQHTRGLTGGLVADYNLFDHDVLVDGQRFTLLPNLSWPLRKSFGHLIPSARAYLASYELTDTDPDEPTSPSYAIPSADIDAKLIFERPATWLGDKAVQTLEPRLYYLYTEYKDQADNPNFDSAELSFSFANLFRNNRFTGSDRIGDANQMTAALTSRILHAATGEELWRFSLGQIFYFADRRVQLAGPTETEQRSPYTGEISARIFKHWTGRASFEWDEDGETSEDAWRRRTLRLDYRPPDRRLFSVAYRADFAAPEVNQYEDTDTSFRWPVGDSGQVELVGRWLYSMRYNETMDAFAGIEFGKCCWRMRLIGRQFKNNADADPTTSIMLQIELAGLASLGDPIGEFLDKELYGYEID